MEGTQCLSVTSFWELGLVARLRKTISSCQCLMRVPSNMLPHLCSEWLRDWPAADQTYVHLLCCQTASQSRHCFNDKSSINVCVCDGIAQACLFVLGKVQLLWGQRPKYKQNCKGWKRSVCLREDFLEHESDNCNACGGCLQLSCMPARFSWDVS